MKALKRVNLAFKILFHITLFVYGIIVVVGPLMLANKGAINNFLNITTSVSSGSNGNIYFDTKFNNMAEVTAESKKIIEETMEEGAVLLKNENNALPLAKGDTVNLYGIASYYSVVAGQGSGVGSVKNDGESKNVVTLEEGLTAAGLSVNQTLNEWYRARKMTDVVIGKRGGTLVGGGTQQSQYVVNDASWDTLPADKNNKAKAGIVVFGRNSGEAIDLYMDTTLDTETMAGDGNRVIVNRENNNKPERKVP